MALQIWANFCVAHSNLIDDLFLVLPPLKSNCILLMAFQCQKTADELYVKRGSCSFGHFLSARGGARGASKYRLNGTFVEFVRHLSYAGKPKGV